MARPTKWKDEFIDEAYELCLLGCNDKELAEYFDIDESTIYDWKKKYPKFSESIKLGKLKADTKVVKSLLERATGSVVAQEKAFKVRDSKGNEKVVKVSILTELAADVAAIKFWLTNRHPEKWSDKATVDMNVSKEELSDDELEEKLKAYEKRNK